jgi:Uma2 family endonuclease
MSSIISSTPSIGSAAGIAGDPTIPPLENGDRLTRAEFRRRWEAMPEVTRAELIEGIVFMGAAVRHRQHGRPQRILVGWLDRYVSNTPGLDGGDNASIGLDEQNEPQPDAYLFLPSAMGSRLKELEDGYLEGPPDWIGEVAASSVSIDMHFKLEVYRRSGVQEYLVWRVRDKAVDWFMRDQDQFVLMPLEDGIYKSRLFPGLWLDPTALVSGQLKRLHAVLLRGMTSPEYLEFAKQVAKYAPPEEE